MSINQLMDSTANFIKPSVSTSTNSQRAQQTSDTTNTQSTKSLLAPIASQSADPEPVSGEQLKQAVDKIQEFTDKVANNLKFSIDEDTGKTVVKILDSQTQEVIRQFPSEEAISIARTLDKVQGLLFSDKA